MIRPWVEREFAVRLAPRDGDLLLTRHHGEQLVGVCLAATRGDKHHLAFVGVSQRRRGIGRSLVEEAAARLGSLTTRFCDVSPFPGVPEESAEFFLRLGFQLTSRECTMRAPLRGFAAQAIAQPIDDARLPALRRLIAEEFEPSWTSMLDEKLAHGARHEVLVTPEVTAFSIVTAAQPCGYFGPMGVAARHRRQGLGRAITLQSLAQLESSGVPEVELWTDPDSFLGQRFYPQLGFVPTRIWHNFDYKR